MALHCEVPDKAISSGRGMRHPELVVISEILEELDGFRMRLCFHRSIAFGMGAQDSEKLGRGRGWLRVLGAMHETPGT